jgi:hypothetical protein
VPIDSVALVHEPLEVEGLSLGDVQGYGVGSLGVVTADGRVCVLGLAGEWQDDIDALLGDDKAARFYRDMNKTSPPVDKKRAEKYLEQIDSDVRATEIANMWEITNGRGNIAGNIRALRESDNIADYYWDNVPASRYNYTDKALWLNQAFRNGSGARSPLFQAHHVIPIDVLETNADLQKLFKWARDNGHSTFDYNNIDNGIMVITRKVKLDINGHGNHPNYSAKIQTKVSDIIGRKGMSVDAINEIKDEINRIKNKINSDVIRGTFDIDNLNF